MMNDFVFKIFFFVLHYINFANANILVIQFYVMNIPSYTKIY